MRSHPYFPLEGFYYNNARLTMEDSNSTCSGIDPKGSIEALATRSGSLALPGTLDVPAWRQLY